jgi:hypothetical protein
MRQFVLAILLMAPCALGQSPGSGAFGSAVPGSGGGQSAVPSLQQQDALSAIEGLVELPPANSSDTKSIEELPKPVAPSESQKQGQTQTPDSSPRGAVSPEMIEVPAPFPSSNLSVPSTPQPTIPSSEHALDMNGPRPVFPWEVISADSSAQLARIPLNSQPTMDPDLCVVPYQQDDFSWTPTPLVPYDPVIELSPYRDKRSVPVQRPWLELGREFYGSGIYQPPPTWFGETNLAQPQFLVYGDYRSAVGFNQNVAGDNKVWANRLNLDMDYRLTSTERIHAFIGPLDDGTRFTGVDFSDGSADFVDATDAELDTLFFEGDAGQIVGSATGTQHPFDMPFTVGLAPLLFQNGVWMEDAVAAVAWTIPARNNPNLVWSNFDGTFFVGFDQINSPAFGNDNNAADVFGTAWFIDAYEGYIEAGYAYLDDTRNLGRSYNNCTLAFTRRYFHRISNSVRWIGNFGQQGERDERTADGNLILLENSLISSNPYMFVPYCNLWCGVGRTQSVARAAGAGGVLRNTGINFESDNLTGYPTLDATGFNTYGTAVGLNMLGPNFRDQWVVEAAALGTHGSEEIRVAPGNQYALGTRYQKPLNHCTLIRTDLMYGWMLDQRDVAGVRVEFRWKF